MAIHAGGNTMIKTLEELAAVELPTLGTYKFIVAEISDESDEGNTKTVLFGFLGFPFDAAEIAHAYRRTLPEGIRIKDILGGGSIQVTDKTIYAYGRSYNYGIARQDIVEKLLQDYAKDKNLEVKVEMGTGY